jgi:Fe-S cluster assembly ATPase SufC
MTMLQIHNLSVTVADKPFLKGYSLSVNAGDAPTLLGTSCVGSVGQ